MHWMDKMSERIAGGDRSERVIRITPGTHFYRILRDPTKGDEVPPFQECSRHFLQQYITAENFSRAPVCLQTIDCPGCIFADLLQAEYESEFVRVKAKRRFCWNAIDREFPTNEEGVLLDKILEVGWTIFNDLGKEGGIGQQWGDFTDPDTGYDIRVLRGVGQAGWTFYQTDVLLVAQEGSRAKAPKLSPLTEGERALLTTLVDLEAEVEPPLVEEFLKVFDPHKAFESFVARSRSGQSGQGQPTQGLPGRDVRGQPMQGVPQTIQQGNQVASVPDVISNTFSQFGRQLPLDHGSQPQPQAPPQGQPPQGQPPQVGLIRDQPTQGLPSGVIPLLPTTSSREESKMPLERIEVVDVETSRSGDENCPLFGSYNPAEDICTGCVAAATCSDETRKSVMTVQEQA